MGLYILACIIVMTFAAIVVTQEPKENTKFPKAASKRESAAMFHVDQESPCQ